MLRDGMVRWLRRGEINQQWPTPMTAQSNVTVVPTTLPWANKYVKKLHRHHAPIPGGFGWFCVAAVVDGTVRGVAIAGRPTNRNNDNGQTVEVLRVASDGTPNVPSALLGACARAAKAIGAHRIITYTLAEEGGTSLRASGWRFEKEGIKTYWHTGNRTRAVEREHMKSSKVRWGLAFRDLVDYRHTVEDELPGPSDDASLFEESA